MQMKGYPWGKLGSGCEFMIYPEANIGYGILGSNAS